MATLTQEPFCYPESVLDDADWDEPWHVLHTRPRAEKSLARRLRQRGQPFFLPLFRREQRIQRRRVVSHLPLFPGYLFVLGDAAVEEARFHTNYVVNCLHVGDQERLHADLKNVYRLMHSGAPLAPEDRLQQGMRAQIVSGPLTGQTGVIVQRKGRARLVVAVDFLQRGASIEVEPGSVRPA